MNKHTCRLLLYKNYKIEHLQIKDYILQLQKHGTKTIIAAKTMFNII